MFDPTGKELKMLQSSGGFAHQPSKTAPPDVWAREAHNVGPARSPILTGIPSAIA
jgi:hypothetical protein